MLILQIFDSFDLVRRQLYDFSLFSFQLSFDFQDVLLFQLKCLFFLSQLNFKLMYFQFELCDLIIEVRLIGDML